jgi:hypothetical protein
LTEPPHDESGTEAFERAELLGELAKFDPSHAASLLLAPMVSRGYGSSYDQSLRVLTSVAAQHPNEVMERLGAALLDTTDGIATSLGGGTTDVFRALPAAVVLAWTRQAGVEAARVVARQLPLPFVDENGVAVVPDVTLAVLDEFGADNETCEEFVSGSFHGESWWGNGADHFRAKALVARRFIAHQNLCVQRWAIQEGQRSEALAREEQVRHEERML